MKRILVPVDFSECSMAAAQAAIAIGSKSKAELIFLHIHPDEGKSHVLRNGPLPESDERRAVIGKIKSLLARLVIRAERAGLKAKHELVFARTQEWIEDFIKPYRIDMVIMGSHGTGQARMVIGSTTRHVIQRAKVPVLVIKKKAVKFNAQNIVFASDFKRDFVRAFRSVIELAEILDARIHLLYVCTPYHFVTTREILANMKRFMHQFRNVAYTPHVYNAVTEEAGIHDFALAQDAGVVALTTRGRTGFTRMIAPSIAERVALHEDTPLLILNIKPGRK